MLTYNVLAQYAAPNRDAFAVVARALAELKSMSLKVFSEPFQTREPIARRTIPPRRNGEVLAEPESLVRCFPFI